MQSTKVKVHQTPGDMRQTEKLPRGEKAEHTREVWDSSTTSVDGTSNQEDWEEGQGPKEPSYTEEKLSYKEEKRHYLREEGQAPKEPSDKVEELSPEEMEAQYRGAVEKILDILEKDFPDVIGAVEEEDSTYEEVMAHGRGALEKAQAENPAYKEKMEEMTTAIQDWSNLCETFGFQVSYRNPVAMTRRIFSDCKQEEVSLSLIHISEPTRPY